MCIYFDEHILLVQFFMILSKWTETLRFNFALLFICRQSAGAGGEERERGTGNPSTPGPIEGTSSSLDRWFVQFSKKLPLRTRLRL